MEDDKKSEKLVPEERFILFTAIPLIIIMIIGAIIIAVCDKDYEKQEHLYDIASLERNSEVEGHFSLGGGYIDTNPVYYFYVLAEKGYILGKIDALNTYIIEDDTIAPSVYKVEAKKGREKTEYYIMYVPIGTIIKEYSVQKMNR